MAKRDLMDYLESEKGSGDKEEEEAPAEKPDLAGKRVAYLAEATGVKDPDALVKLIKVVAKSCMEGPAPEGE
jgi:hypothetical protein